MQKSPWNCKIWCRSDANPVSCKWGLSYVFQGVKTRKQCFRNKITRTKQNMLTLWICWKENFVSVTMFSKLDQSESVRGNIVLSTILGIALRIIVCSVAKFMHINREQFVSPSTQFNVVNNPEKKTSSTLSWESGCFKKRDLILRGIYHKGCVNLI